MNKLSFKLFLVLMTISLLSCAQVDKNKSQTKDEMLVMQASSNQDLKGLQTAVFASGCFWCVEGVYESVIGVQEVISGYAGGDEENPTYHQVGSGSSSHAEAIQLYYDSAKVDFPTLVKVYFASQDPTQVNGQGPDEGTQYRSIIFYKNDIEKQIAQNYINEINSSGRLNGKVAAQVQPYKKFWPAEDYHQDYILHNPDNSYVQHESIPRIKKFQKQFPELIKADKKY